MRMHLGLSGEAQIQLFEVSVRIISIVTWRRGLTQYLRTQKKTTAKAVVFFTQTKLHLAAQHTQQTLRRWAVIAHTLGIQYRNLRLITLLNQMNT